MDKVTIPQRIPTSTDEKKEPRDKQKINLILKATDNPSEYDNKKLKLLDLQLNEFLNDKKLDEKQVGEIAKKMEKLNQLKEEAALNMIVNAENNEAFTLYKKRFENIALLEGIIDKHVGKKISKDFSDSFYEKLEDNFIKAKKQLEILKKDLKELEGQKPKDKKEEKNLTEKKLENLKEQLKLQEQLSQIENILKDDKVYQEKLKKSEARISLMGLSQGKEKFQ